MATPSESPPRTTPTTASEDAPSRAHQKLLQSIARHARPPPHSATETATNPLPDLALHPSVLLLSDGSLSPLAPALHSQLSDAVRVVDIPTPAGKLEHVLHRLHAGLFETLSAFCTAAVAAGARARVVVVVDLNAMNLPVTHVQPVRHSFAARAEVDSVLAPRDVDRLVVLLRALAALDGTRVLVTAGASLFKVAAAFRTQVRASVARVRARTEKEGRVANMFFAAPWTGPAGVSAEMLAAPKDMSKTVRLWAMQLGEAVAELVKDEPDFDVLAGLNVQMPVVEAEGNEDKTCPYAPMRPAQDVYARIAHDAAFEPDMFVIGYEDRHEGVLELPFGEWRRETTHDEFVPMHRVRYFKHAVDGVLWDRRERVDHVFGAKRVL